MECPINPSGDSFTANSLFDGHYKLLRPLNTDNGSPETWLAIDIDTIDKNAAAADESSGKLVSIKVCFHSSTLDIDEEQRLQDEFDTAHQCRHPNLLPPEDYRVFGDTYYLVFDYTEKPSLLHFVGKNIPEKVSRKLISDLASGLDELHSHKPQIIHNDIRPSNIIAVDDETFALTNYGIHLESSNNAIPDEPITSRAYMAPERFEANAAASPESDIWALGAALFEVLTGNKPFGDDGGKNQQADTPIPPIPNQPDDIKELVYACLNADPKMRPTAKQIKEAAKQKKSPPKAKTKNAEKQERKPKAEGKPIKKMPLAIVGGALLVIAVIALVLTATRHDDSPPIIQTEEIATVNDYDNAVSLLLDKSTADSGFMLLDSLVASNDWRATYLKSRLYFDTRESDTIFYDTIWRTMQSNCGIVPNNGTAHQYLFDAFELKEDDFMILYQLGCDFKAGTLRGCKRNLEYALWCFNHADSVMAHANISNNRYKQELDNGRDRISTIDYSPVKPKR